MGFFRSSNNRRARVNDCNAIVDTETSAVLAVSPHLAAIGIIAETLPNAGLRVSVNEPNYRESFFLLAVEPAKLPEWSWISTEKRFTETDPALITNDLRESAILISAKISALRTIMYWVNVMRKKHSTGTENQQIIYLMKKTQAEKFKDSDYNDEMVMDIPFVAQYADLTGFSLREAADEILLKAKLFEDQLAKNEYLRMKYFQLVKSARRPDELPSIREAFIRDMFIRL